MLDFLTDTSTRPRKLLLTFLTLVLSLVTMALGAYAVKVVLDVAIVAILWLERDAESIVQLMGLMQATRYLVFVVGGIAWLVITIVGLEHLKHVGEKRTVKILGWTLLIEILLILPGFFI